jgi:hypothetical protein
VRNDVGGRGLAVPIDAVREQDECAAPAPGLDAIDGLDDGTDDSDGTEDVEPIP